MTPVYNQNGAIIDWKPNYTGYANRPVILQVQLDGQAYDMKTIGNTDQYGCVYNLALPDGYTWRVIAQIPYKGWLATSWKYVNTWVQNFDWQTVVVWTGP